MKPFSGDCLRDQESLGKPQKWANDQRQIGNFYVSITGKLSIVMWEHGIIFPLEILQSVKSVRVLTVLFRTGQQKKVGIKKNKMPKPTELLWP